MQTTTGQLITDEHRRLFADEGYFILERAIPDEHLQILRDACDHLIDLMHQEMDRLGTDHIHISHRGKRYHIAKQFDKPPRLAEYVFSPLMAEVCRATIGEKAYLQGVPAIVPAGSLVVFSSLTFHRSGANTTDRMRRAYVTQYSPQPILRPEDNQPMHLAVPFLK